MPVVATIGADATGQAYNINADTVAGAVAEALQARNSCSSPTSTESGADRSEPGSLISSMSPADVDGLIDSGAVSAGMIPKATACARAVRHGVSSAHILDGRVTHALLLELLTSEGVGSMVTSQ